MPRLRTTHTLVVLIAGKAGVGKTTLAERLTKYTQSIGYRSARMSFADAVKNVARFLGWDGVKDDRGRRLLQQVGAVGREYNENVWAEFLAGSHDSNPLFPLSLIFVDDWRFKNERDFFDTLGLYKTVSVRITAPDREIIKNPDLANDVSETSLPLNGLYYDIHLDNTLESDVYEHPELIWDKIKETRQEIFL